MEQRLSNVCAQNVLMSKRPKYNCIGGGNAPYFF